jgi:hypothetical protein
MAFYHKITRLIRQSIAFYEAALMTPYRHTAYKSYAKEDDLFMLLCFSELLGLPHPVSYYTLEIYPYYVDRFHQWHQRMGMEHSPLDTIKCC